MAREGLHGLGRKARFDPARDGEVPERMPVEVFRNVVAPLLSPKGVQPSKERPSFGFYHAVVAPIFPFEPREDEVIGIWVSGHGAPPTQRADHALAKGN